MGDEHLTHADVERIVQLVDEGGFGMVRFEADGLYVELVREGYQGAEGGQVTPLSVAPPPSASATRAAQEERVAPAQPAGTAPADATSAPSIPVPAEDSPDRQSGTLMISPVIGIFYRSPDPESPPYVQVGQRIEAGVTVGLVEVMKMYTAIKADVSGRVVEVLVENGQQVERGQPLVRIVED